MKDLKYLKTLCDLYYKNPPVTLDEIRNSRIHTIYIIDVDEIAIREVDPITYLKKRSVFTSTA
jgi:hypothetical protein